MKYINSILVILFIFFSFSLVASNVSDDFIEKILLGKHDFTLQWLDNSNIGNRGDISFTLVDNEIIVKGYQEELLGDELNFMALDGTVTILNEREFEVQGNLITRINHINGGYPIQRSGIFIFKSWGKRQYWRLQNQREHEVVDYVDIYFKKIK